MASSTRLRRAETWATPRSPKAFAEETNSASSCCGSLLLLQRTWVWCTRYEPLLPRLSFTAGLDAPAAP